MLRLDGKATAQAIYQEIGQRVAAHLANGHRRPHLAVLLVGDNPASASYVRTKTRACQSANIRSTLVHLEARTPQAALLDEIDRLNRQDDLDGFIVQLPLPKAIDANRVLQAVAPEKDVDGFHPMNLGRLTAGLPTLVPATAAGVLELLRRHQLPPQGLHAVVVGRSNIVGRPVSILLSQAGNWGNATVTLCHSRTPNLAHHLAQADLLVAAAGQPHLIRAKDLKPGVVVIDVGIHRIDDADAPKGYRLIGDVDPEGLDQVASAATPVPGGVGPMTVAALLLNTLQAYEGRLGLAQPTA